MLRRSPPEASGSGFARSLRDGNSEEDVTVQRERQRSTLVLEWSARLLDRMDSMESGDDKVWSCQEWCFE